MFSVSCFTIINYCTRCVVFLLQVHCTAVLCEALPASRIFSAVVCVVYPASRIFYCCAMRVCPA
jgi:hypothetical protein